jgi:heat shock protein 5
LSRAKFEELNDDLFQETLASITRVLEDSSKERDEIDEIALVGGSTRIPKIKELVTSYFNKKLEPVKGVHPEEAVAIGAAIQAAMLVGQGDEDLILLDVTPFTLGIEVVGGVMSNVIERGTVIPTKATKDVTTAQDNQDTVTIRVFEGERMTTEDNHFLGQFSLTGIPPAAKGDVEIKIEFSVNADGILVVTAQDLGKGQKNSIVINNDHSRLTPGEIQKKIKVN